MVLLARNQDPSTLGRASFFRKEIGFRLLAFLLLEKFSSTVVDDRLLAFLLLEKFSSTVVDDRLLAFLLLEKFSSTVVDDRLLEESS